jgi:hypothetical protein
MHSKHSTSKSNRCAGYPIGVGYGDVLKNFYTPEYDSFNHCTCSLANFPSALQLSPKSPRYTAPQYYFSSTLKNRCMLIIKQGKKLSVMTVDIKIPVSTTMPTPR